MAQFIPPLPADSINQPPLPADDEDGIQQLSSLSSNFDSNRLDFGEGDMQNDEQIASKRRRFNACNSHNSTFLPESNHQLGESVKIMQSESDNVLNTIASVTSMCTEAGNSSFASFDAFGDDSILDPDDNNQMIDEYSRSATSPGHDFEIIDDVESEGEEDTSRMRNDDDDSEDSVDENEIDALLDQGMHHSRSKVSGDGAVRDENTPYVEREKIVLKGSYVILFFVVELVRDALDNIISSKFGNYEFNFYLSFVVIVSVSLTRIIILWCRNFVNILLQIAHWIHLIYYRKDG